MTGTATDRGRLIDGRAISSTIRDEVRAEATALRGIGAEVRLDAVLVESGDNGARQYAESQARTCAELGIEYKLHELPAGSGYDEIAGRVLLLNTDEKVSAVMLHMPLPEGVDAYRIQRLVDPRKDVEGVNPANIGNVVYGRSSLAPCTGLAVVELTKSTGIDLQGKRVVVVGASDVVGKPIAVLLMRTNATVVSCNKWTWGLEDLARTADVLVAAAGVPGLIRPEMVKPGAVVIDVGVNRVPGEGGKTVTVGDVDFERVRPIAGHISPVPGGVGPVTVAMLLRNVVRACRRIREEG